MKVTRHILGCVLLFVSLLVTSCDAGQSSTNPVTDVAKQLTGGTAGGKEPDSAKEGEEAKPKTPTVDVEVDEFASHEFARAEKILEENYDSFLAREPLGFRSYTFEDVVPEMRDAWVETTEAGALGTSFHHTAPVFMLALLLLALAFFDREVWRAAMRWQGAFHTSWWEWITTWARIFITVAGRVAPVLAVVLLSYVPVQALFDAAGWSEAITALLWLIALYRLVLTFVEATFAYGLIEVPDEHAIPLTRCVRNVLRVVVPLLALIEIATHIDAREDVRALFVFVYQVALALVPLYLLAMRRHILALFPEAEKDEPGLQGRLRAAVDRHFRIVMMLSLLLFGLQAAGYSTAAGFLLIRGYGLFLLVVAVIVGGDRFGRWLVTRADEETEHLALLRGVQAVVRITSYVIVIIAALMLLEVYQPVKVVLQIPLVSVGAATISAYSILKAMLFFGGAIAVGRVVRAVLALRVFPTLGVDVGVGYAVQTLVSYALLLIGFMIALIALGVNLSAMTVVLASLGVGIGFGLQTLTENLISGFILLFGRSVKKGDIISVGETFGQVEAVGARSVLIRSADNYDMLVPSKEIVGGRIVNWSYENSLIRHRIPVGVTYSANPREVEKCLLEAASRHDKVLKEPAPEVWLMGFGDSSVNFVLLVWFDCTKVTRDRLTGQLYFHIWDVLAENDIEIPFPQRDLHLKSIDFADELRGPRRMGGGGD